MVESPAATPQPFHVRSISMPSNAHPLILRVEEDLQKLKSFKAKSSLPAHMLSEGLQGLLGVHEQIGELLHLPSNNQFFSNLQQKRWVEVELDGSVILLDLLGHMRDCMMSTKEQITDLITAQRRQGEKDFQSMLHVHVHVHLDKKAERDIKNCFRLLKQLSDRDVSCSATNKGTDQWVVMKTLKEAREITISLLQSIFDFLSISQPKTKASRWSLISKALYKSKVASAIDANDGRVQKAQDHLQVLQNSIEETEAGFQILFRRLIQNRVSLLNILSL